MQVVVDLHDSVTKIGALDLDLLSDEQLGELVLGVQTETARLAAVHAQVCEAFNARKAYKPDGSKTPAAWLARRSRTAIGTCRRLFREARRLKLMHHTRQAYLAGEIGTDHTHILCGLAGSPRDCVKDAFVADEAMLVDLAKTSTFDVFATAVKYWLSHVDPDGAARSAKDQYESRRLHLSQSLDGSWHLDGYFDAIQGEIIHQALDDIDTELFKDDWANAKAEHGDTTTADHLARSAAQRRADALVEMAIRARTAPADGRRPAPLFSVLIGYETAWGDLCKLAASGTVVTPGALVPYLSAADLERSVWGLNNRCLDLSVQGPFTGALRRALELRDQECTTSGCTVPAERCDADHIKPRSKGGLTTEENGRMQCPQHNRHKSDKWPYLDDP